MDLRTIPTRLLFPLAILAGTAAPVSAQVVVRPDHFGDAMQYLLPAAAAAITLHHDDMDGLRQLGLSAALSQGTTEVLKAVANSPRPDGSGRGFPSGHVSIAFASASYVHQRYGVGSAVPMYALAGLTAASRVSTHHHFTKDVVAGALIGSGSAWMLTHRLGEDSTAMLLPVGHGAWLYYASTW